MNQSLFSKSIMEVEGSLSWRRGYVLFHDTPRAEAGVDLNRYGGRKVRVSEFSVTASRVCGAIRTDNIDGFVSLVKEEWRLSVEAGMLPPQATEAARPFSVAPGELLAALEVVV